MKRTGEKRGYFESDGDEKNQPVFMPFPGPECPSACPGTPASRELINNGPTETCRTDEETHSVIELNLQQTIHFRDREFRFFNFICFSRKDDFFFPRTTPLARIIIRGFFRDFSLFVELLGVSLSFLGEEYFFSLPSRPRALEATRVE